MTGSRIIIVIYDVQAYERRTGKARKSWEKARKSPGEKPEIRNDPYGCDTPDGLDIRASSTMDCTGLIPSLPESDAELESYAELYHYPADIFKG